MDLKEYIKSLVRQQLEEESTTAGVPGYLTPKAFSPKGQKKNAATAAAEKQGWKVTKGETTMPSDSKLYDYKTLTGKKKKGVKIYEMNELELKKGKGKRYIPPTFPFNEKLLEPFELSKTKEPIRLFKLVSKGEEYILLASPFVKMALDALERGRGSLEKDRQMGYNYSANLTTYLRDNLNPMARVTIKKYLQNAKPGPGGYFPINLTVTKDESGKITIKNPIFDDSEDIQSTLYEMNESNPILTKYNSFKEDTNKLSQWINSLGNTDLENLYKDVFNKDSKSLSISQIKTKLQNKKSTNESLLDIIEQELLNEVTYSKFKNEVKYRTKAEQLHKAIREVKRKLQEIDRIVEYTQRMKVELSEGDGIQYWNRTNKAVSTISEMMNHLNNKIKNLNQ
jgi:hypothetical protein